MACSVGGPNMETNTFSQISKQVNLMVDACYNIVKSKNITIEISQKMNKSVFSFSIAIDVNKKRKKKSPSQKKREEKRRKDWIKKKEDANKQLTTDDSEASDKCESPPIVPGNTDTQMVDDIASDSESTSTTIDTKASDKCESPLIVPGNTDTKISDRISCHFTEFQKELVRCFSMLRDGEFDK